MPSPVLAVVTGIAVRCRASLGLIVILSLFTNSGQNFDARLQFRLWNPSKQFMPKFVCCRVDLIDHPLGPSAEKHHVAATITVRTSARDPTFSLQSM
jgi:hypothetical protein